MMFRKDGILRGGINSTSGGNYAELVNGDPIAGTQELDVTFTMTTVRSN